LKICFQKTSINIKSGFGGQFMKGETMETEKMIKELRFLQNKHANDSVFTFEIRWSDVCRDVADKLESLLQENNTYQEMCKEASYGFTKLPSWNVGSRPDQDDLYDVTILRHSDNFTWVQNVIYKKYHDLFYWEEDGEVIKEDEFTIVAWSNVRDIYNK